MKSSLFPPGTKADTESAESTSQVKMAGNERLLSDEIFEKLKQCHSVLLVDDMVLNILLVLGAINIRGKANKEMFEQKEGGQISEEPKGLKIYIASSGPKGIELFTNPENQIDLIISDYCMFKKNPLDDTTLVEGMSGCTMIQLIDKFCEETNRKKPVYLMCSSEPKERLIRTVQPEFIKANIECPMIGAGDAKAVLKFLLQERPAPENVDNTPKI